MSNIDLKTKVTIRTDIQTLNVALGAMGQLRYDDVAQIITDWKTQVLEQINAAPTDVEIVESSGG